MNKKLYRKFGLYRLFFIEELRDRKYRRTILKKKGVFNARLQNLC